MKKHLIRCVVLFVSSLWPLMMASDADPSSIKSETMLRADTGWNNIPYVAYPEGTPQLTVLKITVPAHEELKWHSHPMPTAAYVASGEITIEEKSGKKQHFSTGQVIPETVNTPHRGTVGDTAAVFIVFYPSVKGLSLAKPEP